MTEALHAIAKTKAFEPSVQQMRLKKMKRFGLALVAGITLTGTAHAQSISDADCARLRAFITPLLEHAVQVARLHTEIASRRLSLAWTPEQAATQRTVEEFFDALNETTVDNQVIAQGTLFFVERCPPD